MTLEEPTSPPPPPSPHAAASSTPARRRVLGDVTNGSPSSMGAGDPDGARRRGRKPGQKNLKNTAPSLPGQSRRGGGQPRPRPIMPSRHPPLQPRALLGPLPQRRDRPDGHCGLVLAVCAFLLPLTTRIALSQIQGISSPDTGNELPYNFIYYLITETRSLSRLDIPR